MAQLIECLTGDERLAGSSFNAGGVIVLCPEQDTFLLQSRKIRPNMTEKLLTGT